MESEGVTYDGSLLSSIGLTNESIQFSMSFDITITLNNNVSFIGTINLDFPAGDIINELNPSIEITDFDDIIFKRI